MAKDPAFLFYSKDFYEGTRMMLPEERACYIDLLIYQHQNEIIPLEIKRVLQYCSGVSEATLIATLEAKFKRTESGWLNSKLFEVSEQRKKHAEIQSENGKIGQFWKKAKHILNAKEYATLKKSLQNHTKTMMVALVSDLSFSDKATLKASLKHSIANAIGDEIENKDEIEKTIMPFDSQNFSDQWDQWKKYKKKQHKFSYESIQSEQASLNELVDISEGVELVAIKIIHQSMAKGWKGLFPIKEHQNGNFNSSTGQPTGKGVDVAAALAAINGTNR